MADSTVASAQYESKTEAENEDRGGPAFVKMWCDALKKAESEEKDWRKTADEAVKLYRGGKQSRGKNFNIFHANVETLCPALYNSTPIPDVRRRFQDKDEVGKQCSDVIERALSFSVDVYDFDAVMKAVLKDGETAGRGIPRVRYVPTFTQDESGQEVLAYEEVTCEYVPWRLFRRGPGRVWSDIRWCAFGDFLTKEELKTLAPKLVEKVPLNHTDSELHEEKKSKEEASIFRRALVWQIWDLENREVISICTDYGESALARVPDPLGLTGFYPIPRPYQPILATDSLTPVVPYSIYEDLVTELNDVTKRISRLVKQVRPRGGYAGHAGDIKAISEAEDGELVPLGNIEAVLAGLGIEKLITWFPLDPVVNALKVLIDQRERVKQTIYEVTGIADILRGATNPNETLGAQQIKAQWGSLRVQDRQAEVQRVARDLFRLKAEIICAKFAPQTLQLMTGIDITPEIETLLRNDVARAYRIDIESDSTIRADLSRNQQNMNNFLLGTGQFAQAMGPIVMTFPAIMPAVMEVYSAFSRQFKLGRQAELALDGLADSMKAGQEAQQQQQKPDPKAEAEKAKLELQRENDEATRALTKEKNDGDLQLGREKLDLERETAAQENDRAEREMAMRRDDALLQRQSAQRDFGLRAAGHNKSMIDEATGQAKEMLTPHKAREELPVEKMLTTTMGQLMQVMATLAQSQQQQTEMMAQSQQAQAEQTNAILQQGQSTAAMLGELIAYQRAPKNIIRDKAGIPVGVEIAGEMRPLERGPDGQIVGMQ